MQFKKHAVVVYLSALTHVPGRGGGFLPVRFLVKRYNGFGCVNYTFSFRKAMADPSNAALRSGLNNRYRVLEVRVVRGEGRDPEKHLAVSSDPSLGDTELCVLQNGW